MWFLIKTSVFFGMVLLVIPIEGDGLPKADERVNAFQAIHAAREVIGDASSLCERKPDVCETGKAAFRTIKVRARESARIAYEMLESGTDEDMNTGSE